MFRPFPQVVPTRLFYSFTRIPFIETHSYSTKAKPTLKDVLKKFYLLVHPDFFQANPKEKEVNQKSLQNLSNYLSQWRKQIMDPYEPVKKIPFTFYLKQDDKSELKQITGACLLNSSSQAAKQSLYELFSQAGLTSEFILGDFTDDIVYDEQDVKSYLAKNAELALSLESLEKSFNSSWAQFEQAMRKQRAIEIGFSEEEFLTRDERMSIIGKFQELLSLLDASPNHYEKRVNDLIVIFGKGINQVDGAVIVLDVSQLGSFESFRFMDNLDYKSIREMKEFQKKAMNKHRQPLEELSKVLKEKSDQIAKIIGVRFIGYSFENVVDEQVPMAMEEVKQFFDVLEKERKFLENQKTKIGKKYKNIEFIVQRVRDKKLYHITRLGELQISPKATVQELLQIIEQQPPILKKKN